MAKDKKIELLAPAGSPEKLKYAFAYGADAVYMGVPDFSLRVRINKFGMDNIKEAISAAHAEGKKIYVTVNIYAHSGHLKKLPSYLKNLNKWRPDALIISDPGVLLMAQKYAPKVPIHLSTQANATNWQAVKFWQKQGVQRVILGREVSLMEIKEIHEKVPKMELEYFVHGAMCMSYSGRCMLSAWLTGRSANLGDCAQPCRWKYKVNNISAEVEEENRPGMKIPIEEDEHGSYIFNSKDLCLIEYLRELIDAGVTSLKIEGRAKSVAYLAMVVKAYSSALMLVKKRGVKMSEFKKIKKNYLDKIMNRGYTTGFLFGRNSAEQETKMSHAKSQVEFVGEVVQCEKIHRKYRVWVKVHNTLRSGAKVWIIQSAGKDARTMLDKIYDQAGRELESAHGGTGELVYFESGKNFSIFSIIFH
ncbi:MAG TPA: U32 family peptidase C-terminal domain-containing protein [Candidatus Magasanikbacteria bacterium]|nr:U32 family peptidase C-terminal domain-containing protein [Candidatus Magasanikbacteria bacterium]